MFNGVTLDTSNYDSLLIGWESQAYNNDVVFHGGNSTYTSAGPAGIARANLVSNGWLIQDGGGI